jgi:hypothetical protein
MIVGKILESWKDSLALFSKKELGLFVLSWLRTFFKSFLIFVIYFGWLVALKLSLPYFFLKRYNLCAEISSVISCFLYIMLVFGAIITVRASVYKKDFSYFLKYYKKFFSFNVLFLSLLGIKFFADNLIFYCIESKLFSDVVLNIYQHIVSFFKIPFLIFVYLFFVDSSGNFKSIKDSVVNGIKMTFLFFPISLILFLLAVALRNGAELLLLQISDMPPGLVIILSTGLLGFVIDFFVLCGVFAYYLKTKHSNYKLFFK